MSQVPFAGEMARELINSRPDLFKNDYATLIAIAEVMVQYKEKHEEYLNSPDSLFERMNQIVKNDAKLRYGVNL